MAERFVGFVRTTTARVNERAAASCLAFLCLGPVFHVGQAHAEEAVGPRDVIRFEQKFERAGDGGVRLVMHRPPGTNGWDLRLLSLKSGETRSLVRLPEWNGAAYYNFEAKLLKVDSSDVVVFEIQPNAGKNAPPGAEETQVAFAFGRVRGSRAPLWREIATTRYSELDGGDRLVVRQDARGKTQLLRETSEDSTFCGGKVGTYAFVSDGLTFKSEVRLEQAADGAEEVASKLPAEPFETLPYPGFYLWYSASSDRRNPDDSLTVIRPIELGDDKLDTFWAEGDAGDGRGEWVTARINPALKTRGLRLFPGAGSNTEEAAAFRSPKKVLVALGDGSRFVLDIPDVPSRTLNAHGGVVALFPRPVRTRCMSVLVLESRASARKNQGADQWKGTTTAIAELTPLSELHGLPRDIAALVVVEMLLKEDDPSKARRLAVLASPLGDELTKVLLGVVEDGTEEDRTRVAPLLRFMPPEQAVPILVQLFKSISAKDRSYMAVKRALVTHRETSARHLVSMLNEHPPGADERKYADLIRLVGRLGAPEDIAPLVDRLGEGSATIRKERIRAVARGGAAVLPDLFDVVRTQTNSQAGLDALKIIASLGRKLHFRGQGTHPDADALVVALQRGTSRRLRMLAVRGLTYFSAEGALDALPAIADEDGDSLIRRLAVQALSRYPGRDARITVEKALADSSPDVRIEAAEGLAARDDRAQSLPALRRYVERERWEPGLSVGFRLIAELGDAEAMAFLEGQIAQAPRSDHAGIVMGAIERADRHISTALARRLLLDEGTSFRLKRNVVDSLAAGDDAEGQKLLLDLVQEKVPFESVDEKRRRMLRDRAVLALGNRRTFEARAALLDLLRQDREEEMQKIALRALAFFEDEALVPELEVIAASAPEGMASAYSDAMDMIRRRARVKDLEETLDDVNERIQRVKEAVADDEGPAESVKDAGDD